MEWVAQRQAAWAASGRHFRFGALTWAARKDA